MLLWIKSLGIFALQIGFIGFLLWSCVKLCEAIEIKQITVPAIIGALVVVGVFAINIICIHSHLVGG